MELLSERPKKNPGTASEGIRVSSEDRVTDLPMMGAVSRWCRVLRTRQARTSPRRALAARRCGSRRCFLGLTWSWGFLANFLRGHRAEGAHDTARIAKAQVFFSPACVADRSANVFALWLADPVDRFGILLAFCLLQPRGAFGQIGRYATTTAVGLPPFKLCLGIALLRGLCIPLHGLLVIQRDTLSISTTPWQHKLLQGKFQRPDNPCPDCDPATAHARSSASRSLSSSTGLLTKSSIPDAMNRPRLSPSTCAVTATI